MRKDKISRKKIHDAENCESELESSIQSDLHDLWVEYDDAEKIVLFLEEQKIYWQARAIAELCEEDGALANWLKESINTGIRENY